MTNTQPRVLSGVPAGGEFAAHLHSDKVPALGAPTVSADFVANRLGDLGFGGDMTGEEITQVTAELNASRDFRDENITAVADRIHYDTVGFTLSDANAAAAGMDHLTRLGHEDEAAAIGRVMAALPGIKDADADDLVSVLDDLESLEINGYDHPITGAAREKLRRVLNRNDIGIVTDELGQVSRDRPLPDIGPFSSSHARLVPDTSGSMTAGLIRRAVDQLKALPDGKTVPVPANDPRLLAGEVFDKVRVDGVVFTRAAVVESINGPQQMRFQANRRLTELEAYTLSGVVGYANAAAIGGEPLDDPSIGPHQDTPYSFVVSIDTTKGRRRNYEEFEAMVESIVRNGTAPRKSKDNTRAIEPFGDADLSLEIYYGE